MSRPSAATPSHGGIESGGNTAFFTRRQQRSSTSQGSSPSSSSSLLRNAAGLAACVGAALGLLVLLAGGIGGSEAGGSHPQQQQPLSPSTLLEKGRLPPAAPAASKPPPSPLPDTKQGRCAAAGKALRARGGWDYMRVRKGGLGIYLLWGFWLWAWWEVYSPCFIFILTHDYIHPHIYIYPSLSLGDAAGRGQQRLPRAPRLALAPAGGHRAVQRGMWVVWG